MNDTTKPVKDVPKRPEVKNPSLVEMSKDELIEFAAQRLIGLMATFDANLYKKDTAYQNSFNVQIMWGLAAYSLLGFRDIGFPVSEFLEEYKKSLDRVQVKKRILG
jgi:hypothetical protein